jgi:hypothetical protein
MVGHLARRSNAVTSAIKAHLGLRLYFPFLVLFFTKIGIFGRFCPNSRISNFIKLRSAAFEVVHEGKRNDGETNGDIMRTLLQLLVSNAPKINPGIYFALHV